MADTNTQGGSTDWGPAILVLVVVLAGLALLVFGVPNFSGQAPAANTLDIEVEGSVPAGESE